MNQWINERVNKCMGWGIGWEKVSSHGAEYCRGWQTNINNEAAFLLDHFSAVNSAVDSAGTDSVPGGQPADWYTLEARVRAPSWNILYRLIDRWAINSVINDTWAGLSNIVFGTTLVRIWM